MPAPLPRRPRYRSMIVAPQPEAVEAGASMLAAGGSAIDAVIACALTQGVVDPMMCGIGGLGILHVHAPASGRHIVVDGLSTCPLAATPEMWIGLFERECTDGYGYVLSGGVNELGHQAVTVPGIMRVFGEAHAAFGRKPWAELFDHAIRYAVDGWAIRPHVAYMFNTNELAVGRLPYVDKLAYSTEGRQLYLRPDGTPKRVGEIVVNTNLGWMLQGLARDGAESFYTGEVSAKILADMAERGGLITKADFQAYETKTRPPLTATYRGRTIAAPPPPAGGLMLAEMLKILERFDLTSLEHNGPEYIRIVAEAMKIAGCDKERHLGDPAFVAQPVDRLLSEAYADECAERIRRGEKTSLARVAADAKDTTTISCVDADGMVVSLTHTNGVPSGVVPPGTGMMLNGAMNWYDPRPGRPGSLAPGKRRYSSMTPTIVFEGETPVMTLGAPGGAWITLAILQVLLNVLDWGMGIQEAISAPRFSATSNVIDVSNRIPRAVERALNGLGYEVKRSPLSYPFAAPHGITLWEGALAGGADPQRDGYAAGVS